MYSPSRYLIQHSLLWTNRYFLVFILCIDYLFIFVWITFYNKPQVSYIYESYETNNESELNQIHIRKKVWKINQFKYILLWYNKSQPFFGMFRGKEVFNRLNCPVSNCYVTSNRKFFKDVRDFDVIAFTAAELNSDDLPPTRDERQKYIFFSMGSSTYYPIQDPVFDGFFNATATYKLNSDIPLPHILVRDTEGNEIGPKRDIEWVYDEYVDGDIVDEIILKGKTRTAAIFYSDCESLSNRESVVAELQKQLKPFGSTVDVYGPCGTLNCSDIAECNQKLSDEYYFYLAFENALAEDYVTGQLLRPLQNNVIPIVFGGANYQRFLPPDSYLDALKMSTKKLVKKMMHLIHSPEEYLEYFWWKKYYSYHDPITNENICNICKAVANKVMWNTRRAYENFTVWWNIGQD